MIRSYVHPPLPRTRSGQKVRNGFNLHSQPFEYFKSSLAFAKVQHAKFWNWRRLSNHFKKHFLFHIEGSDIGQKLFILNLEWFSVMCRVSHHEQSFSTHFLHSFFSQKESEKSVNIPQDCKIVCYCSLYSQPSCYTKVYSLILCCSYILARLEATPRYSPLDIRRKSGIWVLPSVQPITAMWQNN